MLAADFLPTLPQDREALAARFTQILGRDVPLETIAEIVVKVGMLLAEYECYKRASDEYFGSEIWRDLARVHAAADELLQALAPFLNASPLGPSGSGAFLLGVLGLGTAAPATWTDPFIARLKTLCANAERASGELYPHEGHGNPRHKHTKRVYLTRRAIELLPVDAHARTRNVFVGLVFDLAGEPQSKETIRQLVRRAKRDANLSK
jgi:hypothetical protein